MKKVKRREKEEEISEEQEWYRMNLFKTKSKHAQKIILHEPDNRIAKQFAKDLIKNAESRDWEDDNPKQY